MTLEEFIAWREQNPDWEPDPHFQDVFSKIFNSVLSNSIQELLQDNK